MKEGRPLRLGTRGSRLALAQADAVAGLISKSAPGIRVEIVPIRTAGDAAQQMDNPLTDRKFAFTHEIDRQLLEGRIDCGVHSLKDVPTPVDPGLVIAATPPRSDPRDVLVTVSGKPLGGLGGGPAIGTSSIRRKVQLAKLRADIKVVDIRGNVETRIARMAERRLDGVVLAAAGVQRLGLLHKVTQYFRVDEIVPAACQGTLALTAKKDDDVLGVLEAIDDQPTHLGSDCERAFLARLGGDCDFPAGAYARQAGSVMEVIGMVADSDGSSVFTGSVSGPEARAGELGTVLADKLLKRRDGRA